MAENKVERTHYYHADASPIGGYITRPFTGVVPSHASISLPLVGGVLAKERKGRKWRNTVNYSNTSTTVSGKQQDSDGGGWVTEVTATVDDLNIREIITAKRIVAQLSVEHPAEGYTPKISVTGSQYVDLRISGIPVKPIVNYDLFEGYEGSPDYPTKAWAEQSSLQKHVERQYQEAGGGAEETPDWVKHHFHWLESGKNGNTKDSLVCSIVDGFEGIPRNFPGKVFAHSIYVRDFGRVFFGEVIIQGGTYSVSMLRVHLGSPVGGAISAATARSNGQTYP